MHVEVTSAPTLEDREAVVVGIASFEWTHADIEAQRLAILVRDDDGVLIAGLIGRTVVSWLAVDFMWVSEAHRGAGLGASMMDRAEGEAQHRGCIDAYVNTRTSQAQGFYERLGYTVFGVTEDCPPGDRRMSLHKRLDRAVIVAPGLSG